MIKYFKSTDFNSVATHLMTSIIYFNLSNNQEMIKIDKD